MSNKIRLTGLMLAIVAIPLVVALVRAWGMLAREVMAAMVVYALYGLLVIGYLARFALVLFGVFSLYRLFLERHYSGVNL